MINNMETMIMLQRERYNEFVKEAARLRLAQLPQAHGTEDAAGLQQGLPASIAPTLAQMLRTVLQGCIRILMPSGPNGNDRGNYV